MANINKHIPDYNSGYIDYIFNQDTDITKFDDKYIRENPWQQESAN